jgi:hypothetical protein
MPTLKQSMMLIAAAMLVGAATASVQAVTCEDVRSLSRAEQDYWSKRLHLTREQRHQIWQVSEMAVLVCGSPSPPNRDGADANSAVALTRKPPR